MLPGKHAAKIGKKKEGQGTGRLYNALFL
jgi:hypothetical protein